ncbi:MAG: cbb3-type cytochrome c oxidase subunit I [Cyanobacteria bacterium Co-bin8]|nr:cbb3-type cytochrome c oxidase subunit I [Cyanobacteria bacterium Co-bin8]
MGLAQERQYQNCCVEPVRLGCLINSPIVLYYLQGLSTTPIHAHSALFGVYGLLALALMLFSLQKITPEKTWNEKRLKLSC